jgi:hypothetical protein
VVAAELDRVREHRIQMEVIVDSYGESEQATAWYYYLEEHMHPFLAQCAGGRAISPLRPGDEVEVIGMAPHEECKHEMFVMIRWERDGLAVPLSQLEPAVADDETRRAVADWHYWVRRGYCF